MKVFNAVAAWLAQWGADRYLHLLVGMFITYIVGLLGDGAWWSTACLGLLVAVIVGFVKEVADAFAGNKGDLVDIVFTAIGGVVGFVLLGLHALVQ